MTHHDILVIGAGPSGLAATRILRDAGFDVLGLERHSGVGGIWDIDNPGTPMYESAHLISSRTQSALDDFDMSDDLPDYPSHRQLLDYLRAYADHHGIAASYRFGVDVTSLTPRGSGPDSGWAAVTADGDEITADNVVLATGNQWNSFTPDVPGHFDGEQLHSREHRDTSRFAGKRVLIVGAGNSGCDIACDAATTAVQASISVRRGYRFVPKYLFGMPTDVFAHKGPALPAKVEQALFGRLLDVLIGDVTRFGLPAPDHALLSSHPILNTTILDHLGHGDLTPRADVARLDGRTVHFVDGTSDEFDVIVWATGYRPSFPIVDEDAFDWRGSNPNLFVNVFHRDRDDLFVLGMIETDASAWPHITLQAEMVRAWLQTRRDHLPAADAFRRLRRSDVDLEGGIDHVDSPRHEYYQRNTTYLATAREVIRRLDARSTDDGPLAVGAAAAARRGLSQLLRR